MEPGRRCIFLVPETDRLDSIQRLRKRFDPLWDKVPPHVTLVFPFEPDRGLEVLTARLRTLGHRLPIRFSLGRPDCREGSAYFPLVLGRTEVRLLHDEIYAWLPPGLRSDRAYLPHLTFGRIPPGQAADKACLAAEALLPCEGTLRRLVLERIGEDDRSIVELELAAPTLG